MERLYSLCYAVLVAAVCVVVRHFIKSALNKHKK